MSAALVRRAPGPCHRSPSRGGPRELHVLLATPPVWSGHRGDRNLGSNGPVFRVASTKAFRTSRGHAAILLVFTNGEACCPAIARRCNGSSFPAHICTACARAGLHGTSARRAGEQECARSPLFRLGVRVRLLPGRTLLDRQRPCGRRHSLRVDGCVVRHRAFGTSGCIPGNRGAGRAALGPIRDRRARIPRYRVDCCGMAARQRAHRASLEPPRLCLDGIRPDRAGGRFRRHLRAEPRHRAGRGGSGRGLESRNRAVRLPAMAADFADRSAPCGALARRRNQASGATCRCPLPNARLASRCRSGPERRRRSP